MSTKLSADEARYSEKIPGEAGNYDWPARFDISGCGFLGISQNNERVLLSPKQVRELLKFIGASRHPSP